ncbi:hypothetical protein AAFN85_26505 [Mucilaginibacter sp. CAU 1740]|uniref:hypothetical protein n=1 Tax=Mucilaginibacter sp. CAU 1740 TaxID=3140365 RepID=UPI00325B403C
MNRKTVNILVFSIGVMMLLLRPYLIYQLTSGDNLKKNPVKTSLLQRLIKKKDDYFGWHDKATVEERAPAHDFRLPVKRLSTIYAQYQSQLPAGYLAFLLTTTAIALFYRKANSTPSLLSCFRI